MIVTDPRNPKGIVWIASYPKSGNTWMRVYLYHLMRLMNGLPRSDNDLHALDKATTYEARLVGLFEEMIGKPLARPAATKWRSSARRCTRPSSSAPAASPSSRPMPRSASSATCPPTTSPFPAGTIYIVRDPRDVAISLAAHNGSTIDAAITDMATPSYGTQNSDQAAFEVWGSWSEHTLSWTDKPHEAVLVVRYEDMHADPTATFTAVARHLRQKPTPEQIAEAIELSTFKELRDAEIAAGDFRERSERADRFFREGRAGEWREKLTPAQVQQHRGRSPRADDEVRLSDELDQRHRATASARPGSRAPHPGHLRPSPTAGRCRCPRSARRAMRMAPSTASASGSTRKGMQHRRQPRIEVREDPADHGDRRGSEIEQAVDHPRRVGRRLEQDGHRQRVAIVGMGEDPRREAAEIAGRRGAGPDHHLLRIAVEDRQDVLGQRRHRRHALQRPDRAPERRAPDRHAAAVVGDVGAPAADIRAPSIDHGQSGRAGAEDQDGAVAPAKGAEPRDIGVGIDHQAGEGMRPSVDRLQVLGLLRAGETEAGMDAAEIGFAETGDLERLEAGGHDAVEGGFTQAGIAGAARALAEKSAGGIAQARAAAAAAAVDADEKLLRHLTVFPASTTGAAIAQAAADGMGRIRRAGR